MEVIMNRDSVGLADDVYAPHEETFVLPDGATLAQLAGHIARSSYLPMPSGTWGWTIETGDAVVAVRKGFLRRRAVVLRGRPDLIVLMDQVNLFALYARPHSPWRNPPRR